MAAPHLSLAARWADTTYSSVASLANPGGGLLALLLFGRIIGQVGERRALLGSFLMVRAVSALFVSAPGESYRAPLIGDFVVAIIMIKIFGVIAFGALALLT